MLVYRGHKLATIEAKAWDRPLTEGVAQAKDYATKLAVRFAYATNGQGVYGVDMAEMQRIIEAEKSDLFDVLAHVAYALPPLTREERAGRAKVEIHSRFTSKQQAFLDFVLAHYVSEGVRELDQEKLTPLLRLRYHDSIADAVADLGKADDIGRMFAGFQRYLYDSRIAA